MKYHHIPLFSVLLSIAISGCLADKEEFELYMSSGTDITDPTSKCNGEFCPGASCKYPGDRACREDKKQLLVCGTNKQYRVDQTCAYQCDAGQCVNYGPEPEPDTKCTNHNDTKCTGDNVYICQNGEWQIHELCQNGCVNGTCLSEQLNCPAGQHIHGNACEDDSINNCGGIDCEKGNAYCTNGKCTCHAGSVWCSVNGEPEKCVSPKENATCNAHLSEDGSTCEITPCNDNQTCSAVGDGNYTCNQFKCDEDQQLCNSDDGCIPKLNDDNCGFCGYKCSKLLHSNAHGTECIQTDEGKYVCKYECEKGYTNCGTDTAPNCSSLDTFQHCGECNHTCRNDETCDPGLKECIPTDCAPYECTLPGKDGEKMKCVQSDEHCGKNCLTCTNIHANASCLSGVCVISACHDGEHPVFEGTQIIRCDSNTIHSCAPSDIKINDAPIDCTEALPNTNEVRCTEEGKCEVISCKQGFHLNQNNTACLANSATLCGSGDSSEVLNCDEEIENAVETECVSNVCIAKKCSEGFHLSADLKLCEANDTSKCAPVDSADAKDCSIVANATQTECVNGFCKATQCMPGNHLSQDKSECVANSNSLCAATDSNMIVDCTTLANAATAVCEDGKCIVSKCSENYHISQNNTSCVTNTNASCASTTSSIEENCQNIDNASSTECASGSCTVSSCKSGYHLNSGKTGCVANSDTACAATNSSNAVDCNDGPKKVCVNGTCECSADNSLVLNYDGDACVVPACQGIPGVTAGTANEYNRCTPTACGPNYSPFFQSNYGACRPYKDKIGGNCSSMGYTHNSGSICCACESGCSGSCGESYCKSGYNFYHTACIKYDVCCGARCTNCLVDGKKCNGTASDSKCK